MKLRNKRTGDIWEFNGGFFSMKASLETAEKAGAESGSLTCFADSLAELTEEWEDYEEPKSDFYFYIDDYGCVQEDYTLCRGLKMRKAIGNYFETREEAERAVEKLKVWKRLKDKGFRFRNNKIIGEYGNVSYTLNHPLNSIEEKDLELLFGGEE